MYKRIPEPLGTEDWSSRLENVFLSILHFYILTEYPLLATAEEKIENSMELCTNSKRISPVIRIGNLIMCTNNL